ncbi:hypothetical protein B0H16DRAFT_1491720 [Mycena metata]|uniref:Uncharacterized protein n=1 Tax=Mycena metata TaxID=1033252 RepID=A0AAD7P1T8_9AGAR|nr:hypothetical protein B0H16DRAFT_1491720 [Mycena metata]
MTRAYDRRQQRDRLIIGGTDTRMVSRSGIPRRRRRRHENDEGTHGLKTQILQEETHRASVTLPPLLVLSHCCPACRHTNLPTSATSALTPRQWLSLFSAVPLRCCPRSISSHRRCAGQGQRLQHTIKADSCRKTIRGRRVESESSRSRGDGTSRVMDTRVSLLWRDPRRRLSFSLNYKSKTAVPSQSSSLWCAVVRLFLSAFSTSQPLS